MESERFDGTGGDIEQQSFKPESNLQLDLEELVSNSSAEERPPTMIIVETCINSKESAAPTPNPASTKQVEQDLLVEPTEQAAGSSILGLKPNVQFQLLPSHTGASIPFGPSLANTETAISAANMSGCASSMCNDLVIPMLRRCADNGTQCNNLNVDCEVSNSSESIQSIGSLNCRICHNADNPEQLVSPCLCKGSLTYVHVHCLERWISTSRCTICELCQFHYNTEQTLRFTCLQSLQLWYSRTASRRALQEDCQMFSLLTLVAFGIIGTLLVGIQYYAMHTQSWGLSKLWTKSWMLFFLFMTITVYFANIYMLIKSQLTPWYRWWQSALDIKLILENRRPFPNPNRLQQLTIDTVSTTASMFTHHDQLDVHPRVSQPRFATPSSSVSSLPRPFPASVESQTQIPPTGGSVKVELTAPLGPSNSTEAALVSSLLTGGVNPNPNPSCKAANPMCSSPDTAADASDKGEQQQQPQQQPPFGAEDKQLSSA